MENITVVIPARNERFLDQTVKEVMDKSGGRAKVIVIENNPSMRTAINEGVEQADSKYIMKLDAHCMLDKDFDKKLIAEHKPNWVQIPRRKRLDANNWKLVEDGRPDIDYMYIDRHTMGRICGSKNLDEELKKKLIDDTEVFQGSCYFMEKDYFNHLGLLDDVNFGGSGRESLEIVYKVLMDGGRIIRNKKTWYAHAHLARKYSRKDTNYDRSEKYVLELKKQYEAKKDKGI